MNEQNVWTQFTQWMCSWAIVYKLVIIDRNVFQDALGEHCCWILSFISPANGIRIPSWAFVYTQVLELDIPSNKTYLYMAACMSENIPTICTAFCTDDQNGHYS